MEKLEHVHVVKGPVPSDYHWPVGKYTKKYLGELRRTDGSYYSRLERRKYYHQEEKKHINKTPLHIARWAVQYLSKEDDWVLDPTMGAGTTAVEALREGRNVVGIELDPVYAEIANLNCGINNPFNKSYKIHNGDARKIKDFLSGFDKKFQLIVNNPPYSGDENQGLKKTAKGFEREQKLYNPDLENLAFLKEKEEYYNTLKEIYTEACRYLNPGGFFVVGVKDMMRNKAPYPLHEYISNLFEGLLTYKGMVLLKHYPPTLHLSTYGKRYGIDPPLYQTITIFKKE